MSQAIKPIKDNSTTSPIQHRICCNKAIKNHVKIFERIVNDLTFQMYTCSSHAEEYSEYGLEI